MKKSLILGLTALLAVSLTFFSCNNANQNDPTGNTPTTDEPAPTPDTDVLEDKVIWANEAGQEFTTNEYDVYLSLEDTIDLTGYKYLNVEFSATDNKSGQNVIVQPMSETNGGHPQGNILAPGAVSKKTYQTKFGTTYGKYTDWGASGPTEVEIKDNILGSLQLYVQETTNYQTVKGEKITIYKVTATNTELK